MLLRLGRIVRGRTSLVSSKLLPQFRYESVVHFGTAIKARFSTTSEGEHVTELERRVLSCPRSSFPSMSAELIKRLQSETEPILKPLTLLLERMARSGIPEEQQPEVKDLLTAVEAVVHSIPTNLATSILNSIRRLHCRPTTRRHIHCAVANRMHSHYGQVEIKQIPSIFGNLIALGIPDHLVFEDIRRTLFTGVNLPQFSGAELARIAWSLARKNGRLRYPMPIDVNFTEEKVKEMESREIAMTLLAFSTCTETTHIHLCRLLSTRLLEPEVLASCSYLTLFNALKSLVILKFTPLHLFQIMSEHLKQNPEKLSQFNAVQKEHIVDMYRKFAPLLCPIEVKQQFNSMPIEQKILLRNAPNFSSLAKQLLREHNVTKAQLVRRIALLMEQMKRSQVKEVSCPEVAELISRLVKLSAHVTADLALKFLILIPALQCRVVVHSAFTNRLVDRLLFEHDQLSPSQLSLLLTQLYRLKLHRHPIFKVIRIRILDPNYLPKLDGISLTHVAWTLSNTKLHEEVALTLEHSMTPKLFAGIPHQYLGMLASAFSRSPVAHPNIYEQIAKRLKDPTALAKVTGTTLLTCLKSLKQSGKKDAELCQALLCHINAGRNTPDQFTGAQQKEIISLCKSQS